MTKIKIYKLFSKSVISDKELEYNQFITSENNKLFTKELISKLDFSRMNIRNDILLE